MWRLSLYLPLKMIAQFLRLLLIDTGFYQESSILPVGSPHRCMCLELVTTCLSDWNHREDEGSLASSLQTYLSSVCTLSRERDQEE